MEGEGEGEKGLSRDLVSETLKVWREEEELYVSRGSISSPSQLHALCVGPITAVLDSSIVSGTK